MRSIRSRLTSISLVYYMPVMIGVVKEAQNAQMLTSQHGSKGTTRQNKTFKKLSLNAQHVMRLLARA